MLRPQIVMLQRIKHNLRQGQTLLAFTSLQVGGQALGMIAPLVIAKFSSEAVFGRYSLARMIVFFFTSTLIASTQSPFVVYANQERERTGRISRSFTVQCLFFVVGLALYIVVNGLFAGPITAFADIATSELLLVAAAFFGMAIKAFLVNLFMALGQRVRGSLVELVYGVLVMTIVLILCAASSLTLGWVFLTYFLAGAGVMGLFAPLVSLKALLPLEFDRTHLKDMFDFAKWIVAGAAAVYFINWGDNFVLRGYGVPMAEIGTYNFAYQIFKGVLTVALALFAYFLPFISQHIDDPAVIRNYLFSKRPKILVLGLAGIGLLFIAAPSAIGVLYRDAYAGSFAALRVLLIGSAFMLYAVFYAPILNALKLYKVAQTVNILQVTINILLDLVLVPRLGYQGAAVATSIAYFCHAVILEAYFHLRLKQKLGL